MSNICGPRKKPRSRAIAATDNPMWVAVEPWRMLETIAVTGGNGKIGEAILEELNDHGYRSVNLARGKRREEASDEYRTTDLLDAGEVYGSLSAAAPDAVIHMGTIPSPTSHPGHVTYESNVMSGFHVLEAAAGLGIERICIASSINAMGASFQDVPPEVEYLPVDEAHPLSPRDPYGVGKHAAEVTADGFGRQHRPPESIVSLRYPWVATGEEIRESFVEQPQGLDDLGENGRQTLFSYLHLADAASIARRAVEESVGGHEPLWAVAADTRTTVESERLAEEFYPHAEREPLEGYEALISTDRAGKLLDWEPEHSWRDLA